MKLFHTSDRVIRDPDVHYGRINADFGQGFYLTPERDFALRWAGEKAVVNTYELDLSGLTVKRFERDAAWFAYIFHNRRAEDALDADVIIGPIANDTLFDTMGVLSSGFLASEEALQLLQVGPAYTQIALKTERAARQLRWLGAEAVRPLDDVLRRREQEEYLCALGETMAALTDKA